MNSPAIQPGDDAFSPRSSVIPTQIPQPVPPSRDHLPPLFNSGGAVGEVSRARPRWWLGNPTNTGNYVNWLLRLLVGGLFVFSGGLKIADPAKFAHAVGNYRLVPHELINLVAILLPTVEFVAGSFLLAGVWLRAAALLITSLTAVFAVVIVSALARGLNIECGCFGTLGGKHIGMTNLAIDATLFCLAAFLTYRVGDGRKQTISQGNRCAELCNTK